MHDIEPTDDQLRESMLTALALGELDGDERAAVEAMVASNPEVARELDAIRLAARSVTESLHAEPAVELLPLQRERLRQRIERKSTPLATSRRRAWLGVAGLSAAALIALSFSLPLALDWMERDRNDTVAITGRENLPAPEAPPTRGRVRGNAPTSAAEAEMGDFDIHLGTTSNRESRGMEMSNVPEAGEVPHAADSAPQQAQARDVLEQSAPEGAGRDRYDRGFADDLSVSAPSDGAGGIGGGGGGRAEPMERARRAQDGAATPLRDEMEQLQESDPADPTPPALEDQNAEEYKFIADNPFIVPLGERALSTFSIDVDTASYSNLRRMLRQGVLPPPDAVRIEELVNYFSYDNPAPEPDAAHPFASRIEIVSCPWNSDHRLARIALTGREIDMANRVGTNLVFLIDVSGSMNDPAKLPLLKQSLKLLVDALTEDDRVAIVVYAGAAGLVLPPTYCNQKPVILDAINRLEAGGSTNGGAGIQLAYSVARDGYIDGGLNRVILATDGDLNVGISDEGGLTRLIETERESGVFLTVLGFGTGNLKDGKLEALADRGNGAYAYIDSIQEAHRIFIEQIGGTLFPIAKDVKIQVEFNPALVGAYRLIGYENRIMAAADFRDDAKDAGEIGAGANVTALYEIVPPRHVAALNLPEKSDLMFQEQNEKRQPDGELQGAMLELRVRYKLPDEDDAVEFRTPASDDGRSFESATRDLQFASAVALFGMVLRDSPYRGGASLGLVEELARPAMDDDQTGYRQEFLTLVAAARQLCRE